MPDRFRFAPADLALAVAAVLGLALLIGRLPAEHPVAAATYALGPDGAVEASAAFLRERGYATDGLEPAAFFLAHPGLLDSLQHDVGRRDARAGLEGEDAVPAFYWFVRWRETEGEQAGEERYAVRLSEDGTPWYFRNAGGVVRDGLDRAVLDRALGMPEAAAVGPDSALAALLRFDVPVEGVPGAALADSMLARDRERRGEAEALARPQALSAAAAAAIARAHLGATLLAEWPLEVAGVAPRPDPGRGARVVLVSTERRLGRRLVAQVDVAAGGALLDLRTRFDVDPEAFEDDPRADGEFAASFSVDLADDPVLMGKVLLWLAVAVLLLVLFVRRLRLRALDAQAALIDALVAGLFAGLANLLMLPIFVVALGGADLIEAVLVLVVNSLFWAGGVGLMVFVASATADSLARSVWPSKIETLTLVRGAAWLNRPVGLALLRGTALSFALAGAAVALLVLMPDVPLHFEAYTPLFGAQFSLSEAVLVVAQQGWVSLLWVQVLLLGVGSVLMRSGRAWVSVLGVTVALAFAVLGPLEPMVRAVPFAWAFAAVVGAGVALALHRYDALTAGLGILGSGLIASVQDDWLIEASPATADVLLILALFGVALVVGGVGVRRGEPDAAPYVPAYLAEMAERERLTHELDLAREVQQSFLPKQMPEVAGLDFAAACLAAEDVGGDYYDVVRLDARRVGLVIGDVSGKGIHAAFYMTLVKGFVQALWTVTAEPSEVLRRLNRFFCANAPKGMFISVVCGVFDLDARTFTFARAGHNPVLLRKAGDDAATMLQPPGLGVGLVAGERFDRTITDQTLPLAPGDLLVFYTDGVSEAMDRHRRLYGEERLLRLIGEPQKKYAWSLLGALVADVRAFAGGEDLHDDMTVVIVRVTDALGAPEAGGDDARAAVPPPS